MKFRKESSVYLEFHDLYLVGASWIEKSCSLLKIFTARSGFYTKLGWRRWTWPSGIFLFQCWPISDLFQATIKQPENRRTMTLGAVSAVFCSSASCGVKTWTGSGSTFLPRRALKMAVKWKSVNPRAWALWNSPNSVIMKAVILATLVGACVYRNRRRGSAMTLDGSAVSQPSPFHLQLLHGRSYRWRSCGFVVNFIHFYDWWKWLLVTDLN